MATTRAGPPASPGPPAMEPLPTEESWARLRAATVARVAHVVDGRPHVSVVNLVVEDGDVLVRSSSGSRLHAALARPGGAAVAIEVDQVDEQARTGWSVVAHGIMSPVTSLVETARLDRTHPASWLLGDHGGTWLRLHVSEVAGRRLH